MSKTLADILRSYIPDGDGYNSEYAHNLNAAADALESQQSAPAGWQWVPVEMTEDMYLVFCEERGRHGGTFRSAYRAMLAAVPKAEQPPVQEPVTWRCRVAGSDHWVLFPTKRCRFCEPLYAAPKPSDDIRCKCCGYLVTESEHRGCLRSAEPVSDDARDALVEALEVLAKLGNGEHYGNSDGNVIAQMALAAYRAAMESKGDE